MCGRRPNSASPRTSASMPSRSSRLFTKCASTGSCATKTLFIGSHRNLEQNLRSVRGQTGRFALFVSRRLDQSEILQQFHIAVNMFEIALRQTCQLGDRVRFVTSDNPEQRKAILRKNATNGCEILKILLLF